MSRLDTPGLLHHIIIRGIQHRKIFNDDKDRENFIERLSILLPKIKTQCYAWSFMTNHAHFLFPSGTSGIPTLMQRLLTGYAVSYNRCHKRHGHSSRGGFSTFPEQIQVHHMPGRRLFTGIGSVYPFEPFKGKDCGLFEGSG